MKFLCFIICIISVLHGANQVASWTISTNHSRGSESKILLCITDNPLSQCLIRVLHYTHNLTNVFNMSHANSSDITDVTSDGGFLYKARYEGSGLQSGQCGVHLTGSLFYDLLYVSCHLKAQHSGWQTRTIDYYKKATIEPESTVLLLGGNFSIKCTIDYLKHCNFFMPTTTPRGRNTSLIQAPYELEAIRDSRYYYRPPWNGPECNFIITTVTVDDSGPYKCIAYNSLFWNHTTVLLIVPKFLTNDPELVLTSAASYEAGDMMTATCKVSNTRPVASIVWLIGSTIIREDPIDDVDRDVLSWSWEEQNITQNISHQLRATDDGKELICRATVLNTTRQSKIVIRLPVYCGKRKSDSKLISRGHTAGPGEFPWNTAVYKLINGSYIHLCGGTLVGKTKVITAAQCFEGIHRGVAPDLDLYRIVLGKHHLNYSHDDLGSQIVNVSDVTVPLSYHPDNFGNDVAVVKLAAEVKKTSLDQIICLDLNDDFEHLQLRYGSNGTVAGWGLTKNGTQSDVLQWVDLPWVNRTTCRDVIPEDRLVQLAHDIFCAGYLDAGISVCKGDSGSGLVFYNVTTGSYYLRGVVSNSFGSINNECFSQLYTGFTALSSHLRFIKDNLK